MRKGLTSFLEVGSSLLLQIGVFLLSHLVADKQLRVGVALLAISSMSRDYQIWSCSRHVTTKYCYVHVT